MKSKTSPAGKVTLEIYSPAGAVETTHRHAPRLDTMAGKTIGELWNGMFRGDSTFPIIRESLQKQFPDVEIIPYTEFPVGRAEIDSDKAAELVKQRGCQGVIIGNAGGGEAAVACGRAAARIEQRGIPTFVVTHESFVQAVTNAAIGLGFPPGMSQFGFPARVFWPGGDLAPVTENIDKVVYGLTAWQPKAEEKGKANRAISVEGDDYEEAIARMNNLFLRNRWGDGLPVQPPTKRRISWILTGTDISPDTVIGKIGPVGGIATVEAIAINLAMVGGRPEYMPLLIAAVQAIVDPAQAHDKWQATTNSSYPVVIVNGPAGKQVRLNSGHGCLGPDPAHPAGGSIGRAIRLLLQNLGGAVPGSGTMSLYGGPARYTNIVFAEDEEASPWAPLSAERGFPRGGDVATVYCVSSTANVMGLGAETEESALMSLHAIAGFMKTPNRISFATPFSNGSPGVVLMGSATAQGLSKLGWSKDRVKSFLWENSKIPWADLMRAGCGYSDNTLQVPREYWHDPMPITSRPENIIIVVAGGNSARHNYWMQVGVAQTPTSAVIRRPANWEKLLAQAERDLGSPAP